MWMAGFLRKMWERGGRVGIIFLLLAGVVFLSRLVFVPAGEVSPASLVSLSLPGVHRLLVLAPHCDDETIGPGGLILSAGRSGIQVRVVIATNGDGSRSTEIGDFHKINPKPRDYISMGNIRQQESLAALKVLGVPAGQVTFLSYPDRGTPALWNDHWSPQDPYLSPFSRDSRSPYPLTYDPQAVYAGADYLGDLTSILRSYRPDLIVYPSPEDVHPDHWGLSLFTRLAITLLTHSDPTYRPVQLTYLVHRHDYPTVLGYKPKDGLVPPPALYAVSKEWYVWNLSPQDVAVKNTAVLKYRSQLPTLGRLLESFVRANELFAPVAGADLPAVVHGNPLNPATWTGASGRPIPPVQVDPSHDVFVRSAVPAADLVAIYAARDAQDDLWMCSGLNEKASEDILYTLHLKALTADGILDYGAQRENPKAGWHTAVLSGKYVCDRVSLAELGSPYAIFIGASAEGPANLLLDQTAWQMVVIGPNDKP
jgi:LmbE family N-acetylglucosaminyl deacetylase